MADDRPILIAYDGSDGAKAAIVEAGKVLGGGPALVVSVWQSVSAAAPASVLAMPAAMAHRAYEELDRETEQQTRTLADEGASLASEAGFEATARPALCRVNVWSTLVTQAEDEHAAVIVIGSRGHSSLKSALLGSVSHGVASHAPCPVLLVRGER
jgi:nucleotide-binding universal stress UspA family protein